VSSNSDPSHLGPDPTDRDERHRGTTPADPGARYVPILGAVAGADGTAMYSVSTSPMIPDRPSDWQGSLLDTEAGIAEYRVGTLERQ
jgi:hypothetical protein